jgi:hypothetical protein
MSEAYDRQVVDEVARRAARRLDILRREQPDVLADRLASLDSEALSDLLELTRLPDALADRERARRHVGIEGVDYCTDRLVYAGPEHSQERASRAEPPDICALDDEDLLAARRYIPETLPGYVLG